MIYDEHHPSARHDQIIVPMEGADTPIPFLATAADETSAAYSPDGRWIAYSSDESGRRDVYVRGFAPDRSLITVVVKLVRRPRQMTDAPAARLPKPTRLVRLR